MKKNSWLISSSLFHTPLGDWKMQLISQPYDLYTYKSATRIKKRIANLGSNKCSIPSINVTN